MFSGIINSGAAIFSRSRVRYSTGETPITSEKRWRKLETELLHSCDWSLGQIAKHLGYEDVYHFSRRFKALVGVSPNQFRQA
ncbi:helix-turn-helix domain-containing protein [Victivallis vadensis]|uniref:helix-turn-helix domain-containing protein n=1 Tax=Victivallis vadensis TaxID=172901 RepID=UPI00349F8529